MTSDELILHCFYTNEFEAVELSEKQMQLKIIMEYLYWMKLLDVDFNQWKRQLNSFKIIPIY